MGRHAFGSGLVKRQLCGLVIIATISLLITIGFSIAVVASIPTMNNSAMAPVEMNERMKDMEKQGQEIWSNLRPKFPDNQLDVTVSQTLDIVDKFHGIVVKVNGAIQKVPTDTIASGLESGLKIIEKVDGVLSAQGPDKINDYISRIVKRVADLVEAVPADKFGKLVKEACEMATEGHRLMADVESDHFKDMVHKVHSILSQVDADKAIDNFSNLGHAAAELLNKLNSKEGLTIKL